MYGVCFPHRKASNLHGVGHILFLFSRIRRFICVASLYFVELEHIHIWTGAHAVFGGRCPDVISKKNSGRVSILLFSVGGPLLPALHGCLKMNSLQPWPAQKAFDTQNYRSLCFKMSRQASHESVTNSIEWTAWLSRPLVPHRQP
jgi:hypothetical protein